MREEPFQRIGAERGLHVLAVRDAADGADVVSCRVCHIFESHGSQQCLVAFLEERLLQLDDGLHCAHHRFRALLEGIDEHLSAFHILTDEGILLSVGIRTDDERGLVAATQSDGNGAVFVSIDIEVRLDALGVVGTLGSD